MSSVYLSRLQLVSHQNSLWISHRGIRSEWASSSWCEKHWTVLAESLLWLPTWENLYLAQHLLITLICGLAHFFPQQFSLSLLLTLQWMSQNKCKQRKSKTYFHQFIQLFIYVTSWQVLLILLYADMFLIWCNYLILYCPILKWMCVKHFPSFNRCLLLLALQSKGNNISVCSYPEHCTYLESWNKHCTAELNLYLLPYLTVQVFVDYAVFLVFHFQEFSF